MELQEIISAFEVLETLDKIEGQARNQRLQILQIHCENKILKRVFKLTYDWRIDLDINPMGLELKPVDQIASTWSLFDSWGQFLSLIFEAQHGSLGFLSKRKKLRRFLDQAHPLVAKWSLRIIQGDLQIYLSIKLLTKIWSRALPNYRNHSSICFLIFPPACPP